MYNVYIRPLQIEDAAISYLWRNDEEIWKYTGSRPDLEITYDIERDWIVKVITEKISKRFAIIVDGVYVGNIQLTNLTKQDAQYHIFIGDKNYWGKGIAQLATYQILTYARETLQLNEVYLQVNVDNAAAVRVYEKSGFEKKQVVEQNLKMVCFLESLQQPTVSIFCMVYNHEKYIVECLDSLLMQKCTFNYDIVLGEDCSKDNSRNIILNFNERFPGKFKLLLHDQNIGAHKNQELLFKNCKGIYIAICEGDDYWTDPLKLQKQVDFLEANEEFVACQHDRNLLYNDGSLVFEKSDLYIFTQCFMFRNVLNSTFYKYVENVLNGDTFLEYYLKLFGKIGHLNFVGAVYRITGVGVFTSLNETVKCQKSIFTLQQILNVQKAHKTGPKKEDLKIIQSKLTECQFIISSNGCIKINEFVKYLYFVLRYNRLWYLVEYKRLVHLTSKCFKTTMT